MAIQNLISAILPAEIIAEIKQKLADIKSRLTFLITLQPDEIQELFKAGKGYASFLDKAHDSVCDHPEIMPAVFNIEEFKRDYILAKDLAPILNQVKELAMALEHTVLAARSDALGEALEVYAAIQQNKDKVPGLNVVADEMAKFFKKTKKNKPAAAK